MADAATQRLCAWYIRNAGLVGALYGLVPAVLCFAVMFVILPFREVYVLRCVLSLALAGLLGPYLNRFGLELWLLKHNSTKGPATVCDGVLVGAAIAFGIAFLPPLTSLIGTNHPEEARMFILVSWFAATIIGGTFGAILASMGRQCMVGGTA